MGHVVGERPYALCSEPEHLAQGWACTMLSADDVEAKLADIGSKLNELRILADEAWYGITFKRPQGTPAAARRDAVELDRLERASRRVRLVLRELASKD